MLNEKYIVPVSRAVALSIVIMTFYCLIAIITI